MNLGIFSSILSFLFLVVSCLFCVAFFTLLERKILGLIGTRLGPNKVFFLGFLQPLGDAGKLLNKEINSLSNFSFFFYYMSSFFMIFFSIFLYIFLSLDSFSFTFKLSFMIFLIILGLNSLNSILCGWSTYSKFSLLGSIRTVCQLISYEIPLYICFFFILSLVFSFDFYMIYHLDSFIFFLVPLLFMFWLVCVLAELNRSPYDFSEGESELVSGFNVEFGSSCFTLIFLAEYGFIFFFMVLSSIIFFFKYSFFWIISFIFVLWIRSVVPRYRFDKLMSLSWKIIIPQLGFFLLIYLLFIL